MPYSLMVIPNQHNQHNQHDYLRFGWIFHIVCLMFVINSLNSGKKSLNCRYSQEKQFSSLFQGYVLISFTRCEVTHKSLSPHPPPPPPPPHHPPPPRPSPFFQSTGSEKHTFCVTPLTHFYDIACSPSLEFFSSSLETSNYKASYAIQ